MSATISSYLLMSVLFSILNYLSLYFSIIFYWKGHLFLSSHTKNYFLWICIKEISQSFTRETGSVWYTIKPHYFFNIFHICEFAFSLKCICNPNINIYIAFLDIHEHAKLIHKKKSKEFYNISTWSNIIILN